MNYDCTKNLQNLLEALDQGHPAPPSGELKRLIETDLRDVHIELCRIGSELEASDGMTCDDCGYLYASHHLKQGLCNTCHPSNIDPSEEARRVAVDRMEAA